MIAASDRLDALAEIFSLVVSIDHVERAYIRDTITAADYNEVMLRLLSQYNKFVQDLDDDPSFDGVEAFAAKYKIGASAGVQRIKIGIPATAEAINLPAGQRLPTSASGAGGNGKSGKAVAEVAGHFITFSDGVQLGFRGKDDLHPLLADLATSLNRVTKDNFQGRAKIVEWLITLNQLKKGETISEEDSKRCLSDVQEGYNSFLALLD